MTLDRALEKAAAEQPEPIEPDPAGDLVEVSPEPAAAEPAPPPDGGLITDVTGWSRVDVLCAMADGALSPKIEDEVHRRLLLRKQAGPDDWMLGN